MSRLPIDQLAKTRFAEGRQSVWGAIRAQDGLFSARDIRVATDVHDRTIRSYLNCLTAGGILEHHETEDGFRWRLVNDEGAYAPRLNSRGERVTQGMGVEQMWRTMRKLKEFTSRELALAASTDDVGVSNGSAQKYCSMLLSCGYLICLEKATFERQATYRLVRNSGPLAPQIQRVKRVFDPNSRTVYPKGAA